MIVVDFQGEMIWKEAVHVYLSCVRIISLHIRSIWETTVMHKHIPVHIPQTVNFGPNFPESPFLEFQTRKPRPPILENFRFGMTRVYSGIPPPPFWKTSDLGWPKFTPEYTPPTISENAGDRMWRLICNSQGYHSFQLFACPYRLKFMQGVEWKELKSDSSMSWKR